jgi:hypothetical protein
MERVKTRKSEDFKKAVLSVKDLDIMSCEDFSMKPYIREANYYLVYLKNSTWRNASGFCIVGDIERVLDRGYDCAVYLKDSVADGKVLVCKEYHHDKPLGHPSYVVALTDEECSSLKAMSKTDVFEGISKLFNSLGVSI